MRTTLCCWSWVVVVVGIRETGVCGWMGGLVHEGGMGWDEWVGMLIVGMWISSGDFVVVSWVQLLVKAHVLFTPRCPQWVTLPFVTSTQSMESTANADYKLLFTHRLLGDRVLGDLVLGDGALGERALGERPLGDLARGLLQRGTERD